MARYKDTGMEGMGKKSATSSEMVPKVKKRIERNPHRSGKKMAAELNISARSVQRIMQNVLQLKPQQTKVRVERAKKLLRRAESDECSNSFFSDETPLTIEQFVNKQNDRVNLSERSFENLLLRSATRKQAAPMVMV
ncbi:unnamed protein product [Hermetia illucens]|uniref:Uncharacterized protein n=1 Tax=Hermetia illucens TaxID=343691 RepID=A0A7R8Z1S3_HERIL|nr:unnamed protein product [Hermetia illucens]